MLYIRVGVLNHYRYAALSTEYTTSGVDVPPGRGQCADRKVNGWQTEIFWINEHTSVVELTQLPTPGTSTLGTQHSTHCINVYTVRVMIDVLHKNKPRTAATDIMLTVLLTAVRSQQPTKCRTLPPLRKDPKMDANPVDTKNCKIYWLWDVHP